MAFQSVPLLLSDVSLANQIGFFSGQRLPVSGRLLIGPQLVLHGNVDPAVFVSDVRIATNGAGERLDGDLEMVG